jgi:Zn-dependent M28 family amino/carboxypeptidase
MMKSFARLLLLPLAGAGLSACDFGAPVHDPADAISEARLHEHIRILASDEFEGRAPATPGGEKTVAYLEAQFAAMGLEPGNGDSFRQTVPMIAVTLESPASLRLEAGDWQRELAYGDEVMLWSPWQTDEEIRLEDSELVFVGYGTVAPEYGWNDYEGIDVEGKTVVMLVNDPGYATGDSAMFNGRAMTYYGRWTYKFEEAARQGAAGAILIHEDGAAGYGWEVVSGSWSGTQFDLESDDGNLGRAAVESWVPLGVARDLFDAAGLDLETMMDAAASPEFAPVAMDVRASASLANRFESSSDHNVIAKLPGRERPDEYVIYMAHWDHLGKDPELDNPVYNGAVDNATGTAAVLEIARAFAEMEQVPERSIVFLLVTAEEQGLLGSRYYAENPVFSLANTVAGINLDSMNFYGPTHDVTVVGYGNSELDDWLRRAAMAQDRELRPEPTPERGYFYRSDHFSFAREGVPALYPNPGIDHVERGEVYGRAQLDAYLAERYHRPQDEYDPDWDLSGLALDSRLLLHLGLDLASSEAFPNWREGNEFRAARDEMRRAAEIE